MTIRYSHILVFCVSTMFDQAYIEVVGGKGGRGAVAFRREKFVPRGGPVGGDGGHGGDVFLIGDISHNTLAAFRYQRLFKAARGGHGGGSGKRGANGPPLEVPVPLGTGVWEEAAEDSPEGFLGELVSEGKRLQIASGGRGGRGNARFVTSTLQEPLLAEDGEEGQRRALRLELKLVADIGLVGLPNAGKSSLIAGLSKARPKIADYPFTTIEPVLGVVECRLRTLVAVDIPGLIEGAHRGVGLGYDFLRHIERTRALVHVVDGSEVDVGRRLRTVMGEIRAFSESLAEKPVVVAVNKADVSGVLELREEIMEDARSSVGDDVRILFISAVARQGLDELRDEMLRLLERAAPVKEARQGLSLVADQELPVLRPLGPATVEKVRREQSGFRVVHPRAVRLAGGSDLGRWKARVQLMDHLERMGVIRALREMGVKRGDVVMIADWEFTWE